ncbi:MAG TPA: hypothetical protein VEW70_08490 [Burkholderiales bacterium]|nr:hypothetical protein [Burkholderiales bacterium]
MPAWLIPALKAALPHVASIVAAASPAFTRKNTADQNVLQQQITELQAAATTNDAQIKELAAQIKNTVELLEIAERRHQRLFALCVGTIVLSLLALGIAIFALVAR